MHREKLTAHKVAGLDITALLSTYPKNGKEEYEFRDTRSKGDPLALHPKCVYNSYPLRLRCVYNPDASRNPEFQEEGPSRVLLTRNDEIMYLDIYVATLQSRQNCLLQPHEKSVSWNNFCLDT
jgi:hypothetical protein